VATDRPDGGNPAWREQGGLVKAILKLYPVARK